MRMTFALACVFVAAPLMAADCSSLASVSLDHGAITSAATVAAGQFILPGGGETPAFYKDVPEFCRVQGVLTPATDSHIEFEVWLPTTANWNGKFFGQGNGGFAGSIGYAQMADAINRNYATASTDTGHKQKGQGIDASWSLQHPEKIVDFGYRAIHLTAVSAKKITAEYYGRAAEHAYFASCSNGGRQALMEAQRFPSDYDGIIAGAPANNWTHLLTAGMNLQKVMYAAPENYIPAAKIPAIAAATLAYCDAKDGLKDNLISDPPGCKFDPSVLACLGADSNSCLTEPQVSVLRTIYSGLVDSSGKQIFPGTSPGGEAGQGGWEAWVTGSKPRTSAGYGFSTQFFADMVYGNANWDFHTFDPRRGMKDADTKMSKVLNSTNPDLSAFRKVGGKLILYHGWSDAAIPALSTVEYFNAVSRKMGAGETGSFVRFFLAPGMQHCSGGPGPNVFFRTRGDADHDLVSALDAWITKGAAPDKIIAVKFEEDRLANPVLRSRPLCAYPKVARYTGSGSLDDAANFTCSAP